MLVGKFLHAIGYRVPPTDKVCGWVRGRVGWISNHLLRRPPLQIYKHLHISRFVEIHFVPFGLRW